MYCQIGCIIQGTQCVSFYLMWF